MRRIVPAAVAGLGALLFAAVQWLRAPEPPGLDQSLFAYYGHWLARGLVLYRDLWDSKPPGIFALYAFVERGTGVAHAAWFLDALAALAAGALAYALAARLGRAAGGAPAGGVTAALLGGLGAALVPSAPVFGGPLLAGQAEPLMAPLLFGAALAARSAGRRWTLIAGVLIGLAVLLKIVAVFLLPIAWAFAPAARRKEWRFALLVVAGAAVPLAASAVLLALQGALGEAVQAVLVYPRAYAAEIASRMPLGPALVRGVLWLGRGLPLLLLCAAWGAVTGPRTLRPALVWLGLAAFAVGLQRQMAGYHLYLVVPPLALLAGFGAVGLLRTAVTSGQRRDLRGVATFVAVTLAVLVPASIELRRAVRHYAPHRALRAGALDRDGFLVALGGPGPSWQEAGVLAASMRAAVAGQARAEEDGTLLVWGLAPAVYARAGWRPATRWVFHQTLLVEGSPLARRWPDAAARRAALVEQMQADPPRFVIVATRDRSGLEPEDSRRELGRFPALGDLLATRYRLRMTTPAYELLELQGERP